MSEQPAEYLARLKVQFPLWSIRLVPGGSGYEACRMFCREWSQTLAGLEAQLRSAGKSGRFALRRGDRVELIAVDEDYLRFALAAGDQGTVLFTDSLFTVHVAWDNGRKVGIIAEALHLVRKIGRS